MNDAPRSQRADQTDCDVAEHARDRPDRGRGLCPDGGDLHRPLRIANLDRPRLGGGVRLCACRCRHTYRSAHDFKELTRMSFETFALIWPIISIGGIAAVAVALVLLQDRAWRRKAR